MHKILLVGPLPPPLTGPSVANTLIRDSLNAQEGYHCTVADTSYGDYRRMGKFSFRKVFFYLMHYKYLMRIRWADTVYLIPGQTFLGVVRYSLFIYLARLLKKQVVIQIRGGYLGTEYRQVGRLKKKIIYHILCRVNKGIVLSQSLRYMLQPFLPINRIYILKNFVQDDLWAEQEEPIIHTDRLRILFLSNLIPEKGILDVLDALLLLKARGVPFHAALAGEVLPIYQETIERKIQKLADVVTYHGVVQGRTKRQLLHESNVFVLPTYYKMEGQPISILEAYATGNIVVTTDHAGICDIFSDGRNGFYVEKNSPNEIADQLEMLHRNLGTLASMMQYNVREAREKYTTSRFMTELVQIFEDG